jgi:glycosyltransferase involved in cell wall biosynthesis
VRRLLFYTHALVGGGAERVWALLASGLAARGHEVRFAVDFEGAANRAFLAPEVPITLLGPGHARTVTALSRLLAAMRPDVALAAVGASNGKLVLARFLARHRGAAVLSAHGRIDVEHGLLGRLTYLATPLFGRMSARTVVPSDDLRRYLIDRFASPARRTITIPNPVSLPPLQAVPSAAALAARPDVIVAMGRLVPEKGLADVIAALARLAPPARLVILGEGPERAALEALAARLRVADRVAFRGYVPEPWPELAGAKMLALASRTEAFGNVLVEALAHGLPVVATRCGGPAEILGDGRHGRLVPIGDVGGLAAAIGATLADPGDPARHRARAEDYALPRILDRWEALLDDVLAAPR